MKKKMALRSRRGRFVLGLLAVAVLICAAFFLRRWNVLKADMSAQKMMTPSEQVIQIARSVDKDVSIRFLTDEETDILWVEELARRVADENSRIDFAKLSADSRAAYEARTRADTQEEACLIVFSENRSCVIPTPQLYDITYDTLTYYYTGQLQVQSQRFAADGALCNALLYVTREDLPVVYALTGHGEGEISSTLRMLAQQSNVVVRTLEATEDGIPEDAAALMLVAPTQDLEEEETTAILSYLKQGGRMILLSGYRIGDMPNLKTVLAYYGMELESGVVIDMAAGYSSGAQTPQVLTPTLAAHEVTAPLLDAGVQAVLPVSTGIKRNSIRRSGLNVVPLATSSDESYLKANPEAVTTLEKEEDDREGPFVVAMAAAEGDTRLLWFACGECFSDAVISQLSSGANTLLLRGALGWMATIGQWDEFPSKDMMVEELRIPESWKTGVYAALFLPALAAFLIGLIRRRNKKSK